MTPDEHLARAEELLNIADEAVQQYVLESSRQEADEASGEIQAVAAVAQVHAILSLRGQPFRPERHVPTNEVVDYNPDA